jgi:phosphoribosyl-ATP pyrophosphohydrolase
MDDYRLSALADLARSISSRRGTSSDESYTAKLLSKGIEKCAKKLGEEAVEAALAAVTGDRDQLVAESADVLYHLLVLLEASGVGLEEVMAEIQRRKGISGIAEKASRPKD